jgi:hypothetical protein
VWSGLDNEKDKGKAEAKMDMKTFMAFLVVLERAVNAPNGESFNTGIEMGFPRDGKITITADLKIYRDKNGVVGISVVSRNGNSAILFPFTTEDFHRFQHKGGESYSEADISQVMALGYVRLLNVLVPQLCKETWKEPEPRQGGQGGYNNNRGGQGGGYNNNRNGGGGYNGGGGQRQAPAEDSAAGGDDDIPW